LQLAALTGHPAINKNLPSQFNKKPLLLITDDTQFTAGENYLIRKAELLGKVQSYTFYKLPVHAALNSQQDVIHYYQKEKNAFRYFEAPNYFGRDSIFIFYHNNFETYYSPEPFKGAGSLYSKELKRIFISDIQVNIQDTIWIEISYWAKSYIETPAYPSIDVCFLDGQDNILKSSAVAAKTSTDIIGDWVRASENYELTPSCKKIRLSTTESEYINFDELVVRHTAFEIFHNVENDSTFSFNNYPVGN
jgi:hypothetical protein